MNTQALGSGRSLPISVIDPAPIWPDTQAVAYWALMNSRGERILSPE